MISNTGGHAAAAALLVGHVPPPAGAQQRGRLGPRPPGGQSGCCALELVIPRECSDQPPVRQHPQQLGLAERERPLLQRGRPGLLPRHRRGCWRPPPHRGPRHQTCQGGSDLCLIKLLKHSALQYRGTSPGPSTPPPPPPVCPRPVACSRRLII